MPKRTSNKHPQDWHHTMRQSSGPVDMSMGAVAPGSKATNMSYAYVFERNEFYRTQNRCVVRHEKKPIARDESLARATPPTTPPQLPRDIDANMSSLSLARNKPLQETACTLKTTTLCKQSRCCKSIGRSKVQWLICPELHLPGTISCSCGHPMRLRK